MSVKVVNLYVLVLHHILVSGMIKALQINKLSYTTRTRCLLCHCNP